MFLYRIIQYCFLTSSVIFTLEDNFTKFNNDSTETEFACENVTSTCFSKLNESYTTELTDSDIFPPTSKTTTAIENVTSTPVENVTTQIVTPKPEIKKETKRPTEKNCHCDLTSGICDINCCCDVDCNKWERSAFSMCIGSKPTPTYGQCISTDIIYRNNTPYPTTRSVGGLLCISKDNFPERNAYMDQEVIKSIHTFQRIWKRKKRFSWHPEIQKPLTKFEKKDIYKFGEPLWKYDNATDEAIGLDFPSAMTSTLSVCRRRRNVSYLKDVRSTCLQRVPMDEQACLENSDLNPRSYCQDVILIASPSLVNSSYQLSGISENAFVKVKQVLCANGSCNETTLFPEPVFDKSKKSCLNSVLKLHLLVSHNGSLGITEAVCSITLGMPSSSQMMFEQTFEVEFQSANLNTRLMFHRSGTPGYRDGMPVVTNIQKGSNVKTKTSLAVVSGENCMELTPVLFRENSRTQCTLKIPINATLNCSSLENQIITKMLHGVGDIGLSGDPSSWLERPLPMVTVSMDLHTCNPPSLLSLRFLYAFRGSLLKPEARIVGLFMQFDRHRPPTCSRQSRHCDLRLVTMVSFTDVSRPVISKYASAPVVKIKLPQDFFYPFSSSSHCSSTNEIFVILSTILCSFNVINLFK